MTHLLDPHEQVPGAQAKASPDGKRFFVLTERGILKTNVREYEILLFDDLHPKAKPLSLAKFQSSSNRDGIAEVKWVDNDQLSFIAENPNEVPQVYIVSCRNRKMQKLTADDGGVLAYDVSSNLKTVAYYSEWTGDKEERYAVEQKDQHGFAVTNENLQDLLFSTWMKPRYVYQLKLLDRIHNHVRTSRGLISLAPGRLAVKLSPSGKYAVTEQPAFEIQDDWRLYKNRVMQIYFANARRDKGRFRQHYMFSQLMLVDTRTGDARPLMDAPTGPGLSTFSWAPDERSISIVETFLPLAGSEGTELEQRESQTALVEIQIPSLNYKLISYIPRGETWKISEEDQSGNYTVQRWAISDGDIYRELSAQLYQKVNSRWERTDKSGNIDTNIPTISVAIDRRPKLVLKANHGAVERGIFDPNPDFDRYALGKVEIIRWTGKKGESLIGGLVYPTNYRPQERYPLVIQTHGFSPDTFLVDGPFTTSFAAQELANRGVAVLQIGESPLYDQTKVTPQWGEVLLSQLESGIDYLESRGIIDRQRVGLVGFSITGYTVWYALTHSSYQFRAATTSEGNDFGYFSYLVDNSSVWTAQSEAPYGGPPWGGDLKNWIDNSVSFNYQKIHTPLRVESETNPGEILNEWEHYVALKRLNKPVDLIFEAHGYHPVEKPWDRMTSQQGNVDWLLFWLTGEEDPDPAKSEQYARWHDLKKLNDADLARNAPNRTAANNLN